MAGITREMHCFAGTAMKCYRYDGEKLLILVKLLPHEKDVQKVEINEGSTGLDLLEKLNLAYDAHIITRGNEPISIDEELRDSDEIGIIKVVSGG